MKSQMQIAMEAIEKIKMLNDVDLKAALISSGLATPEHHTIFSRSFAFDAPAKAEENNFHQVVQFNRAKVGSTVSLTIGFA